MALIPEDRKTEGLMLPMSIADNIAMAALGGLTTGPFIDRARERAAVTRAIDQLKIKIGEPGDPVATLSGGNQQKVVIARWLYSQAKLLILDEPTQGVDIGAKLEVYRVINELTRQGISILLISSDYPELLAMSDRIAVVRDGSILHIAPAGELSEYELLSIASGAGSENGRGNAMSKPLAGG
jgi:ribose transport system ATP-binding protein